MQIHHLDHLIVFWKKKSNALLSKSTKIWQTEPNSLKSRKIDLAIYKQIDLRVYTSEQAKPDFQSSQINYPTIHKAQFIL